MVERSYYWDGDTTGDAILAKFNEFVYHGIWRKMFIKDRTVQGIIRDYENECQVVGVSGGITVDKGAALVDGQFYENTEKLTIDIPVPTSSTRIDSIVLRRNSAAQTIRATRIAGAEGGSAPSIVQIDDGTWDIKIAEASITTSGAITVTDSREYARSSIFYNYKPLELIEEIIADGGETQIIFEDVPQTYTHLVIYSIGSVINGGSGDGLYTIDVIFNDDNVNANYNFQRFYGFGAVISVLGFAGGLASPFLFPQNDPQDQGGGKLIIPNYTNTNFYKCCFASQTNSYSSGQFQNGETTLIWENTSAIEKIEFSDVGTIEFSTGTRFALYGIK